MVPSPAPRMRPRLRCALMALCCLPVVACVKPNVATRPLAPERVFACVTAERERPAHTALSLADATALLRRHNPEVRRARAQWRAAQAVACVATPYPNPSIEAGPLLLGGGDILSSPTWGVEALLGWTVLLTDTPGLQDDVNAVRARAAFAEAASAEREQYLLLRGEYAAVLLRDAVVRALDEQVGAVQASLDTAEQAVAAGSATALDVKLLALETAEIRAERIDGQEAATEARGALGATLGVDTLGPDAPFPSDLPSLPDTLPTRDALRAAVTTHHPHLTALQAAYLITEKELRLEVARRYPPLGVGLAYEWEDLSKFGLPLGIEVPLFDRNQPGVARAMAERDAAREAYAAEVNATLAALDTAYARVTVRRARLDLQAAQLEPAKETQRLAQQVLEQTGSLGMLRYLEVLRATRRARVAWLVARADLYAALSDLEQACGMPLLDFPSGPGTTPVSAAAPRLSSAPAQPSPCAPAGDDR